MSWKFSILILVYIFSVGGAKRKKSLFDELPLNGALTTTTPTTPPSRTRVSRAYANIFPQGGFRGFNSLPNARAKRKQVRDEQNGVFESMEQVPTRSSPSLENYNEYDETVSQDEEETSTATPVTKSNVKSSSSAAFTRNQNSGGYSYESTKIRQKSSKNFQFSNDQVTVTPASPAATAIQSRENNGVKHHTTISIQTIPITKQVTEFVRVPNIVHHITTASGFRDSPFAPIRLPNNLQPLVNRINYSDPEIPFLLRDHHLRQQQPQNPVLQPVPIQNRVQGHWSFQTSFGLTNDNPPFRQERRVPIADVLSFLEGFNGSPRIPRVIPYAASHLHRTPTIDLNDAQVLREIVREQRYQLRLNDLNSRLHAEKKAVQQARSDYDELFSRGALMISAMTLIPTVLNPVTATVAAAGTAALPAVTNYLLPLIPTAIG